MTALWLEGRIKHHPGYGEDPDPETTETPALVCALAALNRSGCVSISSQPGDEGVGYDGLWYVQRAAFEVLCTDEHAARLRAQMAVAGYGLIEHPVKSRWRRRLPGVPVTRVAGVNYTEFGTQLGRADLALHFDDELNREALAAVCAARQVTVYDPTWGDHNTLWPAVKAAAARLS